MKIGVSSYSFHQAVEAGTLSTYGIVDTAARMGFASIDFADPSGGRSPGGDVRAPRPPGAGRRAGRGQLRGCRGLPEQRPGRRGRARAGRGAKTPCAWARAPSGTTAPGACRRTAARAPSSRRCRDIAEGCRRVTEYAAARGIRTMVENHGTFLSGQPPARAARRGRGPCELRPAGGHGQLPLRGRGAGGGRGAPGPLRLPRARKGLPLQALHRAGPRPHLVCDARRRIPARHGDRPRRGAGGSGAARSSFSARDSTTWSPSSSRAWSPAWRPCSSGARTCRPCCKGKKKAPSRNQGLSGARARNVFLGGLVAQAHLLAGGGEGDALALGAVAVGELRGEIRAVAEGEEPVSSLIRKECGSLAG